MLSTRSSASFSTPSRVSSLPTLHPDSVALLQTRVPENLHSVLSQYVFCDSNKHDQARRFRYLLRLEASATLIVFLEKQEYAPQAIYDLYFDAPTKKPLQQSAMIPRRRISVPKEDWVYTSTVPLPADAQSRIQNAGAVWGGPPMAAQCIRRPVNVPNPPAKYRRHDLLSAAIPDSLEAPALAEWLRSDASFL